MRRIGRVIECDAVFAVRGAFARDDENLAIGSCAELTGGYASGCRGGASPKFEIGLYGKA